MSPECKHLEASETHCSAYSKYSSADAINEAPGFFRNFSKRYLFLKYRCHDYETVPNGVPPSDVFPLVKALEEADTMTDVKTYRDYAADCMRIAQSMNAEAREALLKMAEAWEDLAREAERRESTESER